MKKKLLKLSDLLFIPHPSSLIPFFIPALQYLIRTLKLPPLSL